MLLLLLQCDHLQHTWLYRTHDYTEHMIIQNTWLYLANICWCLRYFFPRAFHSRVGSFVCIVLFLQLLPSAVSCLRCTCILDVPLVIYSNCKQSFCWHTYGCIHLYTVFFLSRFFQQWFSYFCLSDSPGKMLSYLSVCLMILFMFKVCSLRCNSSNY